MFSNDYIKQASRTPDKQQGGSDVSNQSTNQSLSVRQDTETLILGTFPVSFNESMSLIKIRYKM